MARIYKNQSFLHIEIESIEPLTDVASAKIKFIRPDGTTGEWNATITGQLIDYKFTKLEGGGSELNQDGNWTFWHFLTATDGRTAPGDAFQIYVHLEGTV